MRKAIIIVCNSLSLAIILNQFGVWNALLLFLLVGAIPGTTTNVSPIAMLVSISLITMSMALAYLYSLNLDNQQAAKKSLPKKRYGRL